MDEDYDIYGGAPWSAYADDIDPYEAEWERRAEEEALRDAEAEAAAQAEIDRQVQEYLTLSEQMEDL